MALVVGHDMWTTDVVDKLMLENERSEENEKSEGIPPAGYTNPFVTFRSVNGTPS